MIARVQNPMFKIAINDGSFAEMASLEQKIEATKESGAQGMGLWFSRSALDSGLANQCGGRAWDLVGKGLKVVEVNFLRGWMDAVGAALDAKLAETAELARFSDSVGCDRITVACFESEIDYSVSVANLKEIAAVADEFGQRVCVEFLPWGVVSTLQSARELIRSAGASNLMLVVDSFHFFMGGSSLHDLSTLSGDEVGIVHLSDFRPSQSKYDDILLKTRRERVFPGDGELPLRGMIRGLRNCGYGGWFSIEVLSEISHELTSREVARIAVEKTRQLIATAVEG
jgi:sugar phosphate isomerase/epimerase